MPEVQPKVPPRYASFVFSVFFAASLLAATAAVGCAARATYGVRYYDVDHRDYHTWDAREDHAYRQYLMEKHERYRDFSKNNQHEQDDYWTWRHGHPDSDRH
jgi:hypothetical protein